MLTGLAIRFRTARLRLTDCLRQDELYALKSNKAFETMGMIQHQPHDPNRQTRQHRLIDEPALGNRATIENSTADLCDPTLGLSTPRRTLLRIPIRPDFKLDRHVVIFVKRESVLYDGACASAQPIFRSPRPEFEHQVEQPPPRPRAGGRRLVSIVSPPERQKALKSIQRWHSRIERPRQCVPSSSRFKTVREFFRGFEIDLSEYLKADPARDAGEILDTAGCNKHKRPLWSNPSRILTQYELWISVLKCRFNTIKRILETNRLNSAPRASRSRWYSWDACTTSRVGGVRKPNNRTVYHSHLPRMARISVKRKPLLCHR